MNEIKNNGKKWFYWFMLGVCIIIVYKLLDNFSDIMNVLKNFISILTPFLVGVLIAYLLYIPCKKVEKLYKNSKVEILKKKSRAFSIFTVYFIAILLIIILFNFILPIVINSVTELATNIQGYYENTLKNYDDLPESSILKSAQVKEIIDNIKNIDIKQFFNFDKIFEYVKSAIQLVTGIFDIFVAFIVSVYILAERTEIMKFLKRFANAIFKKKTYENIGKYFNKTNQVFFKFLSSQFLDAIVVGILTTIAMSLMGVRYAPLLGFMIGLFNMIPYFGAIIAVVIAALITLITGGFYQAVWMIIIVTILQQIDANIINPKIIGESLKMSPLLIIFSITVGGAYFGVIGMFLAVPVCAVIKIIVNDYIEYKNEKKDIR